MKHIKKNRTQQILLNIVMWQPLTDAIGVDGLNVEKILTSFKPPSGPYWK